MLNDGKQCNTLFSGWACFGLALSSMLLAALQHLLNYAVASSLAIVIFYLSLITTSLPLTQSESQQVDRAIALLEEKGFSDEVLLLKHAATFRSTDHWLNSLTQKERAYASTNFPFQIITLYSDFYLKAADDTERAMVLLHEARHLMGENEHDAYAFVWRNRSQLGWTQLTHGTTANYITIEEQTRENAPEIFNCPNKPWLDCTL